MAEETGRNMAVRYELYYWPSIQGRGEFVRLALEDAGADYIDVAREPSKGGLGMRALLDLMDGESVERPPFAPPFSQNGQTNHWPDDEHSHVSR